MESENPHCFRAEALYFYNVSSNICEPFFKGHCARSRNKFNTIQECQEHCVINNQRSTLSRPTQILSTDLSNSSENIKFKRPGFESRIPATTTTTTTKRPIQLFKRPRTLFNRRRTARLFWDCFFLYWIYFFSIFLVSLLGYFDGGCGKI